MPLSGTLVIDVSDSVAGQYCGRMLAMNGARVVLVEPPGGSPLRTHGPQAAGGESYLFRHLNQGKESICLDPAATGDVVILAALLDRADVVIRDQRASLPGPARERLVECVIGQFPQAVPYAAWQGTEMIQQALSGVMDQTGRIDREPIYGVGERASYAAGTTAYISVVSALWERRRSGHGQRVSATAYEAMAGVSQNIVSEFSYNGSAESRGRYPGFLAQLRCADAWITLFAIRNWPTLCYVFGHEEWLTDPRFATQGERLANWPVIVDLMQENAVSRQADELVAALQAGRVSAERITSPSELVAGEQWAARHVLSQVGQGAGAQPAMSGLYQMSGARTSVRGPSPDLDASRSAVLGSLR
jgi:crotonobetainyl-CoA:carnitine CoA-transferase CaiB-like acyl-CoA transferase